MPPPLVGGDCCIMAISLSIYRGFIRSCAFIINLKVSELDKLRLNDNKQSSPTLSVEWSFKVFKFKLYRLWELSIFPVGLCKANICILVYLTLLSVRVDSVLFSLAAFASTFISNSRRA